MSYTDPERESVVPHAVNQTTIAGGRITLYQRDDVKNAVWHCRMRLPGISGYIRRSTDTSVLKEAEEKALQILGELTQKQAHNLPIKKKTFSEIATSYLKDAQTRLAEIAKAVTISFSEPLNDISHRISGSEMSLN